MAILVNIFHFLFVASGIILIMFVLLRQGDSGGLSGAFGGVGGDAAFGVKAQQHLDKVITYVAAFFIVISILLNIPALQPVSTSIGEKLRQETTKAPVSAPAVPANTPVEKSK